MISTIRQEPSTVRISHLVADQMVLDALKPLDAASTPAGPLNIRALGDSSNIDYTKPFVFFTGIDTATKMPAGAPDDPHRATAVVKLLVGVSSALVAADIYALSRAVTRVTNALENTTIEGTSTHRLELAGAQVGRLGAIDPIDEQNAPDIVAASVTIDGALIRQSGNSIGSA